MHGIFFKKKRGKNLQAITKTVVVVEVAKNSQKSTIVCGIGWPWNGRQSFQQITYTFIIETQICNFILHGPSISTKDENEK